MIKHWNFYLQLNQGTESIFDFAKEEKYIIVNLTQDDLVRKMLLKELEDMWTEIKVQLSSKK